LRYARSAQSTSGNNIETLYNIIPGQVEATEFIIKENSPIIGKPLCQLKFKENVLVGAIYRNKQVIVPRGNDVIEAGDAVVIISEKLGITDVAEVLR
jgi:trk system potassium uptake protein TrkA